MATLIREIAQFYKYLNEDVADPRTQNFLFIASPWYVISILLGYLFFVFNLGPGIMMRRKPFRLERILQMYNALQIIVCTYVFYKALLLGWLNKYSLICEPVDFSDTPEATSVARTVWIYFMVKLFDLLDTVFFVLRKKDNQITFLHVYHHGGMVLGSWIATKYLPGGHVTFLGLVNSFVHVVMYSYYLATSLKFQRPWWKKHITQLQLTQFMLLLIHFSQLIWVKDCGFPKWTAIIFIPQNLFMIILFGEFYYKAYIVQPKKKPEQNGVSAEIANGKPKAQ